MLLDTRRAAGLRMRLKLHIRHGSPLVIVVEDNALRVEPPSSQPEDCHLLVDPVAFLLVSFHRISPASAALTGEDHRVGPQALAAAEIPVGSQGRLTGETGEDRAQFLRAEPDDLGVQATAS